MRCDIECHHESGSARLCVLSCSEEAARSRVKISKGAVKLQIIGNLLISTRATVHGRYFSVKFKVETSPTSSSFDIKTDKGFKAETSATL